ncbi:MAG: hypothetical protein AB7K09_17730 [Planctomycetota bacterium]
MRDATLWRLEHIPVGHNGRAGPQLQWRRADNVTYRADQGLNPYTGYASAPTELGLSPDETVSRRYSGNLDAFDVNPKVATVVTGKQTARGLEQHYWEQDVKKTGDASKVANRQHQERESRSLPEGSREAPESKQQ